MNDKNWTFEVKNWEGITARPKWVQSYFRGTVEQVSEQARVAMLANAIHGRVITVRLKHLS